MVPNYFISSRLPPVYYSLNGALGSLGVPPRAFLWAEPPSVGSTDPFRGVCIPDGVDVPLAVRLREMEKSN